MGQPRKRPTRPRRRGSWPFEFDPANKGRAYSKGNRQKVALIAALATPAELCVLDEPTSGLDPIMETVFNQEIERVAKAGATVLFSSHILSEVEQLCDRVSNIRAGKTVETGTLDQLRHLTRSEVSFAFSESARNRLAGIDGIHDLAVTGGRVNASHIWGLRHGRRGHAVRKSQ